MDEIRLKPIGVIRSPFKDPRGAPIQATNGQGVRGFAEVFEEYAEGLDDLDGFSHVVLICHLHLARQTNLKVTPFLDTVLRGVFSTRAPSRPNHLGLTIARLVRIEGNTLHLEDLDIVDGTPLLDIKPYVPRLDQRQGAKLGWLEGKTSEFTRGLADDRFTRD